MKIVTVFYHRPFFLSFDIALIDVSIYQDDTKQHFGFPVPIDDSSFEGEPLQVKTRDGNLLFIDGKYRVVIDNANIRIDLSLTPCFGSWQPRMISLFKNQNQYFNWKVLVPQGDVEGTLRTERGTISISGKGYLDYNEGNFPLNEHLSSWYWGRLQSAESSLIFGSLNFEEGSSYHPLLWVDYDDMRFCEPEDGVFGNENSLDLSHIGIDRRLKLGEQVTFDRVNFLMSPIPVQLKFPRRVHEFVFYRLEETGWGRKINRFLANVKYERRLINASDVRGIQYQGLLEHITFKQRWLNI